MRIKYSIVFLAWLPLVVHGAESDIIFRANIRETCNPTSTVSHATAEVLLKRNYEFLSWRISYVAGPGEGFYGPGGIFGPAENASEAGRGHLLMAAFQGQSFVVPINIMQGTFLITHHGSRLPSAKELGDLTNGLWHAGLFTTRAANEIRGQILPVRPLNDNFRSAFNYDSCVWNYSARIDGATVESEEPAHFGNTNVVSIWFRWRALTSGPTTVWSKGSNFNSGLVVYNVASLTNLVTRGSSGGLKNPATHEIKAEIVAESGMDYFIALIAPPNSTGAYDLSLNQPTAPFVVREPSPVQARVIQGNAVNLIVNIEGSPPPAIQWQHSVDGTNWANVVGGNGETLIIEQSSVQSAGFYRTFATNSFGDVLSRPAQLKLFPSISGPISGVTKRAGVFGLQVNEIEGYAYIIEGTSQLTSPVSWLPLWTNVAPFTFLETNLAAQRFYRTRVQ